ncbi:FTR1 family protein [Phormidium yuhuli AB48]|uniref:FTR1 family protein n=1 Tax=Phormidium yuhuli AB48 TaxID=2940671 RepID=A0ABY5AN13_9CYAN|nr:FTR1 family protein [Phormidium yuhuli]USR90585.1 FTR1 family protein [Phormidium yuhuli AB48]
MTLDLTAALPTFVITLREGFEAALVVGIVLSCLKRAQQSQLNRWVFSGVGAGVGASALVGWLFYLGMGAMRRSQQPYAPIVEPLLEGVLCLVAILMLSWMLLWMTQQARSLKGDIEGAVTEALAQDLSSGSHPPSHPSVSQGPAAAWGIFSLVFIAVLREGFETVVFILAKFQQGWVPTLGALAGLAAAATLGLLLFRTGVKINVRQFFQVMGLLLLLIVSGLVISALKQINGAVEALAHQQPQFANWCNPDGVSCVLGGLVWDARGLLPDQEFPGIILKTLFGYRDRLYVAQAIAYVSFLSTAGWLYFLSLQSTSTSKPQGSQSS